ncbi:hypothetical protein UlMin_027979 [Ulmus minor]
MNWVTRRLLVSVKRQLELQLQWRHVSNHHLLHQTHDGPTKTLREKVAELEKNRKRRKKDPRFIVEVPEGQKYLDTPTVPMTLAVIGIAVFAKLLMMIDESKSQERLERKIKDAPPETGTVRMLSPEEWDEIKDVRPRTPFESKLARPNARIRTGEPLRMDDLKDWTIDVLTDALTRAEDSVKSNS